MMKLKSLLRNKRKRKLLLQQHPEMIYNFSLNGKLVKGTRIGSSTCIVAPEYLSLGENVFIGQYNFIEASNGIVIEEGCQITNFISIVSHSSHISIRLYGTSYREIKDPVGYVKGEIKIEKYSFIGPHVTIMPNSKIGKGSIVSAYTMLKGEFPDFAIISGNPAKVIGDTREIDNPFFEKNPDLKEKYEQWAKD